MRCCVCSRARARLRLHGRRHHCRAVAALCNSARSALLTPFAGRGRGGATVRRCPGGRVRRAAPGACLRHHARAQLPALVGCCRGRARLRAALGAVCHSWLGWRGASCSSVSLPGPTCALSLDQERNPAKCRGNKYPRKSFGFAVVLHCGFVNIQR